MRKQRIVPGRLAPAYEAELGRLRAQQVIARLWNREPGLWKDDAAHAAAIANRLGWLSVVDQMRSEAADLMSSRTTSPSPACATSCFWAWAGPAWRRRFSRCCFPRVPAAAGFSCSIPPIRNRSGRSRACWSRRRTLFVVASKSGSTVETLSQFQYFLDRLQRAGVAAPGKHFIAITDAGSRLDKLAQEHDFRRVFRNPADIGGRYSALSFFGLVPAALWGVDVNSILDSASEMMAASGPQAAPENNPALRLAALLGAGALQGCDKLFLLSPRKVEPLGNWIEQLVAESTGKEGRGIVPIVAGPDTPIELLEQGAVTVALTLDGHDDAALARTMATLEERGAPLAEIRMAAPADLGAEFFRWEVATVLAGMALSIDPFDEPNVQESKDATGRILREFESTGQMPQGSLVLAESGIELYHRGRRAEPRHRPCKFPTRCACFFPRGGRANYLALLAYVARDAENAAELEALRLRLAQRLQMPVLLGYGPRYLHSIGQLYKGGPASGLFVIITSRKAEELPIPGAPYTFAQLQMAQALGDMQRLAQRNRPAVRLHLAQGARPGWQRFARYFRAGAGRAGGSRTLTDFRRSRRRPASGGSSQHGHRVHRSRPHGRQHGRAPAARRPPRLGLHHSRGSGRASHRIRRLQSRFAAPHSCRPSRTPRAIWMMIPSGAPVDHTIESLRAALAAGRYAHRRRQQQLQGLHAPRGRAAGQGHRLCRRRHQRRHLGTERRLQHDDRRRKTRRRSAASNL